MDLFIEKKKLIKSQVKRFVEKSATICLLKILLNISFYKKPVFRIKAKKLLRILSSLCLISLEISDKIFHTIACPDLNYFD